MKKNLLKFLILLFAPVLYVAWGVAEVRTEEAQTDGAPAAGVQTTEEPAGEVPVAEMQASGGTSVPSADIRVGISAVGDAGKGERSLWKPGCWTNVRVQAPEGVPFQQIRVTAPDSDGVAMVYTVDCGTGTVEPVEIPVIPGRVKTSLSVEFLQDGQVVASETRTLENPIPSDRSVVLVIGGDAAYFERASELLHVPGSKRPAFFRIADAGQLPRDPRALSFVSTIVVAAQDEAAIASWTTERLQLLERWVERGGFLVLTTGVNTPLLTQGDAETVAGWRRFFPGTFEKVVAMPQTTALEHYAQSLTPVPLLGMSEEYRIPVARFQELSGDFRAVLSQYDLPLILESVRDFGRVAFVAFDLEHEALKRWSDTPALLGNLLGFTNRASDYELKQVAGMHYGYDDMAGQLRSALDDFPTVHAVSFWTLSGLLTLYLAIIGPGCFFLCRKAPRHGEALSWNAFLLSVLVVCGLLYWLSRSPRPAERLNRIALTDITTESGDVRQMLWGTLWTSTSGSCTLALNPLPESEASVAWLGLPGPFLGGLASNAGMVSTQQRMESRCDVTREALANLPMSPRSTKCLMAERWTSVNAILGTGAEDGASRFGTLEDRVAIPYGTVRNPLDVPLEHVLLLYNGWAYDLKELPAGGEIEINDTLRRYDVTAVLVDDEIIEEGFSAREDQKATRRLVLKYNPASRDLEYILKTMLFYASVDGRAYTGLENKYQFQTDITPILRSGKAVLYGRVKGTSQNERFFADFTLSQKNGEASDSPVLEGESVQLLRVVLPVTLTEK